MKISETKIKEKLEKSVWNKGKKGIYSEETLLKMSLAKKGKHYPKMSSSQIGRKHSDETKLKMSKSATGKVRTKEHQAKLNASAKGRIMSQETRLKMSLARKGIKPNLSLGIREKMRKRMLGNTITKGFKFSKETRLKMSLFQKDRVKRGLHNFWKGGITPKNTKIRNSIEFCFWRESVFGRDNYTCQKCDIKGGKLNAHHIKNFASFLEVRLAIDNGITLCEKCHKKFHIKYGKIKTSKMQLEEFLINN